MNCHFTRLVLTDGISWTIRARDPYAKCVLDRITEVAGASHGRAGMSGKMISLVSSGAGDAPDTAERTRIGTVLYSNINLFCLPQKTRREAWAGEPLVCLLDKPGDWSRTNLDAMSVLLLIGLYAQADGGMLVHGALAEKDGAGVILAGRSGAGKTTASRRFQPPWRSLCDDTALIMQGPDGVYRAHPWPTWGMVLDGSRNCWPVGKSVPVRGIFFLDKSESPSVYRIGDGRSICMLLEASEQASWPITNRMEAAPVRMIRMNRFENACRMVKALPCYVLRLNMTGPFWDDIESVLKEEGR